MKTKINRRLNIVVEVTGANGQPIFVHSMPVAYEVFESNYLLFTKTVSSLYSEGLAPGASSRIAMLHMKKQAEEIGTDANPLFNEIWRLTNVLVPSERGWDTVPFEEAVKAGEIDEEDAREVKNILCFFTAASWVHSPEELQRTLYPILQRSGLQITSSDITEFKNSLPMSKPVASSGEKATASSLPL